jgi:hypothetical protein
MDIEYLVMKYTRILFFALGLITSTTAFSQSIENGQAEYLGQLWGMAEGLAAAITVTSKPTSIEKLSQQSNNSTPGEHRIYINNGLIVKVLAPSASESSPESVELTSPEAILKFSKGLSELTKSAVIPNLGTPASRTASVFTYSGPSEICDEHLELFYRADQLSRVRWSFCGD